MPNPAVHWQITSKDAAKAQAFYAALFGWTIQADHPSYAFVSTGENQGLSEAIGHSDGPSRVTLFVEVDDPQTYLDKAVSLGGKVELPVSQMPDEPTSAIFWDEDGLLMGLLKRESSV